jgi:hypothetical protein
MNGAHGEGDGERQDVETHCGRLAKPSLHPPVPAQRGGATRRQALTEISSYDVLTVFDICPVACVSEDVNIPRRSRARSLFGGRPDDHLRPRDRNPLEGYIGNRISS